MTNYLYGIIFTDGELKPQDVYNECTKGAWIPLACIPGEKPIVLLANSPIIANNFIKRNIPRHWTKGGIRLDEKYLEIIKNNGWDYEILNFPRKMQQKLEFVVLELDEEPLFKCN